MKRTPTFPRGQEPAVETGENRGAAAGFALAFLRRARTLAVAAIGLTILAVLTRHRERSLA